MNPKEIDGKWYIEIFTEDFSNVLLLDSSGLTIAIEFKNKNEAVGYINYLKNKKL